MVCTNLIATTKDYSFIERCNIPYSIMLTIAYVERERSRDAGYPYIVSFNAKKDYIYAKEIELFKDVRDLENNRNVDCLSKKKCTELTDKLLSMGIDNIDVGAYQLNVYYHKLQTENYFSLEHEYSYACKFINSLIKSSGKWDWETLAKYHSSHKSKNIAYQKLLKRAYKKLTKE